VLVLQYGDWEEEGSSFSRTYRLPHILAQFGLTEIMAMILETGADIDYLDRNGRTPLTHAVKYGHVSMVELFIEQRAHVCS
jgi:ankyrin repeat protein